MTSLRQPRAAGPVSRPHTIIERSAHRLEGSAHRHGVVSTPSWRGQHTVVEGSAHHRGGVSTLAWCWRELSTSSWCRGGSGHYLRLEMGEDTMVGLGGVVGCQHSVVGAGGWSPGLAAGGIMQ